MTEPQEIPFPDVPPTDDGPGIWAREAEVGGARWAVVEYAAGAGRDEYCEDGHRGFVIRGEIRYEFDDESPPLAAKEGEAFLLPPAARGSGAHRGRNPSSGPTRLFLIDDHPGG